MTVDAPSKDRILDALRARGTRVRRLRYRPNRSVLVSVSRDGRTLNLHECFQGAPGGIAEAVASFVTSPRGSPEYRRALERIRGWEGAERGIERVRRRRPRRSHPGTNGSAAELAVLGRLYDDLNRSRFAGRLPVIALRVSRRMSRALGTISYSDDDGVRRVREIAINADLFLPVNRWILRDTLLHEMAHAEAWLRHGHRGHGPDWRRIATRVGCAARALTWTPVRTRR